MTTETIKTGQWHPTVADLKQIAHKCLSLGDEIVLRIHNTYRARPSHKEKESLNKLDDELQDAWDELDVLNRLYKERDSTTVARVLSQVCETLERVGHKANVALKDCPEFKPWEVPEGYAVRFRTLAYRYFNDLKG